MTETLNPIAFSNLACPEWDLDRLIAAASEWGFQGIELRTFGAGSSQLAGDPALSDPEKIRHKFESAGIGISCLATGVALHYRRESEAEAALAAGRSFVDLAAALGCPAIRCFGYQIAPGESRHAAVSRTASRYQRLAEYAEESGTEILIENAGTFARSRELWNLTNFTEHPLVGICWNVANAAAAGERPGLSVTTLNSRIRYGKLKDAVIGEGSGFVPIGEGTCEVERFVELMRGIGFTGWFCLEWDRLWLPGLEEGETVLPRMRETLHNWMRAKFDKKGKPLSKYEAPALEAKA